MITHDCHVILGLCLLFIACDKAPTPPPEIASITIIVPNTTMQVGQSQQLTAVLKSASGEPLIGRTVTWSSTDIGSISVSSTGEVTAIGQGTSTISATSNLASSSVTLTSIIVPAAIAIRLPDSLEYKTSVKVAAEVIDAGGRALSLPVQWSTVDSSIAFVDSVSNLVARRIGSVTITASSGTLSARKTVKVYSQWAATEQVVEFTSPCSHFMHSAIGHLNPNGREDVVLGGWLGCGLRGNPYAPLRFLVWSEDGQLIDQTTSMLGASATVGVNVPVIRDLNGDGRADVYLAGFGDFYPSQEQGRVYINQGKSFRSVELTPKVWAHGSAVSDLNGDGCIDLLQGGAFGGNITETYFWFGNCGGSFTPTLISQRDLGGQKLVPARLASGETASAYVPGGMAVCPADFNNDGIIDVLYADGLLFHKGRTHPQNNMIVEFDWSQLTPTNAHLLPVPFFDRNNTGEQISHDQRCHVGDLNNDGRLDVIISSTKWNSWDDSSLQVYLNSGQWRFEDKTDVAFDGRPKGLAYGYGFSGLLRDLNSDGKLDFWFPSDAAQGKLESQLWRGNGDGTFTQVSIDWSVMYETALQTRFPRVSAPLRQFRILEPVLLPRPDRSLDFLIGIEYSERPGFERTAVYFLARTGFRF